MKVFIVKFIYSDRDRHNDVYTIEGSFIEGIFSTIGKAKEYIDNREIPQEYKSYHHTNLIIPWELDEPLPKEL